MEGAAATLTKKEADAAIARAGVTITDHQLERWRGLGLLPPARQRGLGRGHGSSIDFTADEVAQAIDAARLFGERRKNDWVGWRLWLRGYEVHDDYWQPVMERAQRSLSLTQAIMRRSEALSAVRVTQLIQHLPALLAGSPFASSLARMDGRMVETMIGFLREITSGTFSGFSHNSVDRLKEHDAVVSITGTARADRDKAGDQKLAINDDLENVMRNLSTAIASFADAPNEALFAISNRRDFHNAINTSRNLISVLTHTHGKSSFGLGKLNRIVSQADVPNEAAMFLLWSYMRPISATLLPAADVAEIAERAKYTADEIRRRIGEAHPANK